MRKAVVAIRLAIDAKAPSVFTVLGKTKETWLGHLAKRNKLKVEFGKPVHCSNEDVEQFVDKSKVAIGDVYGVVPDVATDVCTHFQDEHAKSCRSLEQVADGIPNQQEFLDGMPKNYDANYKAFEVRRVREVL